MIVKIIDKENKHVSFYDCHEVVCNRLLQNTDDEITFDIIADGNVRSIELDKHKHEMYIMNNDGGTIEAYRWN